MKLLVLILGLSAIPLWSSEECSAKNRGKFYPESANLSKESFHKAAQDGTLKICVSKVWGYRWENLTVRVPDQKRKP